MEKKIKKIAVLGYGTVGSGVVELLDKNKDMIEKRIGQTLEVKYILDIRDFSNDKYQEKHTKNFEIILKDDEIEIVAEVIGGATVAYEYTKRLLESGKSVVTSNKELVSKKGPELLKIAEDNHVKYLFEASVAGGIPIIHPILNCLCANEIDNIVGILNGTTNYILTQMIKENKTFEEALKRAQELGYAESNPEADVKGHDACRKISILASLVLGKYINPDRIYTKGIDEVTLDDVEKADKQGYVIKLLGYYKKLSGTEIEIFVSPCAVKKNHLLANVENVFNKVVVSGDATGEVAFYGKGAGKLPTASAVCSDIIECIQRTLQPKIAKESNIQIREFSKIDFKYIKGTKIPILN